MKDGCSRCYPVVEQEVRAAALSTHLHTISVELHTVSEPEGNIETTVGGNKPLHRFMRCQPKILGTVMLIIGVSLVIMALAIGPEYFYFSMFKTNPSEIFLGTLFTICGILFIVTEHNPTKKTVTLSLALSIVSILSGIWTVFITLNNLLYTHFGHRFLDDYGNVNDTEIPWISHLRDMTVTIDTVFIIYNIVGAIILIITSVMAGAALRSTKTQAIVVAMTVATSETPAE